MAKAVNAATDSTIDPRRRQFEQAGWVILKTAGRWEAKCDETVFGMFDSETDLLDGLEMISEIDATHAPAKEIPSDERIANGVEVGTEVDGARYFGTVIGLSPNNALYLVKVIAGGESKTFAVEPTAIEITTEKESDLEYTRDDAKSYLVAKYFSTFDLDVARVKAATDLNAAKLYLCEVASSTKPVHSSDDASYDTGERKIHIRLGAREEDTFTIAEIASAVVESFEIKPAENVEQVEKQKELFFSVDSSAANWIQAHLLARVNTNGWNVMIQGQRVTAFDYPDKVNADNIEKAFANHLRAQGFKFQEDLAREAFATAKAAEKRLAESIKRSILESKDEEPPSDELAGILGSEIPIGSIVPSPLPSQKRRRKRFEQSKLEELADSIRRHGVVNPITVRKVGEQFEIIAGERRFLASQIAGLEAVPAIVKELDDTAAAEIQLIENGQRVDQHPMDEAFDYLDMKTVLGFDEVEIANRVGKTPGFVLNRLKLTAVAERVRELLETNLLPIAHALEIAKYPVESHETLLSYAIEHNGWRGTSVVALKTFISKIQEKFLLQLKKSPFSTKSTELRADGLACEKCPERTNANPLLFEEQFDENDCCLNRKCWDAKTKKHVELQRVKIASTAVKAEDPAKIEKAARKIPLITKEYWVADEDKPAEKYLSRDDFAETKRKDECEYAERGVFFNGDRVGQTAWICKNKDCKVHFGRQMVANSATSDPVAASEARRIRKEEIFDSKVAEAVRRRVLQKAAGLIDESNTIFSHKRADEWKLILLRRLWYLQCAYSSHTAEIIRDLLDIDKKELSTSVSSYNDNDWAGSETQIAALSETDRARLLFLLLFAHESEIYEAYWSWKPQKPIKDLAEVFEIDYRKLDAQERLNQAPMKLKDIYRTYQEELEAGTEPSIPRPFSDKWKPKD